MINRDGEVIWNYEYCFILIILLKGQPVGFIFCGRSLFLPSKSVYQCLCMSVYVSMFFLWLLHWTLQEQKKKKKERNVYISLWSYRNFPVYIDVTNDIRQNAYSPSKIFMTNSASVIFDELCVVDFSTGGIMLISFWEIVCFHR